METIAPTLGMVALILGAWIVLSLPLGFVVGHLMRRGPS
jgi:hypothetical protein